jgi:hypothetical protein
MAYGVSLDDQYGQYQYSGLRTVLFQRARDGIFSFIYANVIGLGLS